MTMLPATTTSPAAESQDCRRAMLRTAFGPVIAAALADPAVIEVMWWTALPPEQRGVKLRSSKKPP